MKERRKGRSYIKTRVIAPAVVTQRRKAVTERHYAGTFLAKDIKWITGIKGGKGCGCKTLATEMDKKGPDWCEENSEYIIGKMMENSDLLAEAIGVAESTLHTSIGQTALKAGAKVLLWNAIRKDRASQLRKAKDITPKTSPRKSSRRGGFAASFRAQGTPRFITSAQMQNDIKKLVSKIPSDVTAIAGVARSGLAVATMVSMYTHLPMFTIRQNKGDIQQTGNGWRLGGNKHVTPKQGKVLVVDDTVMTGNSLKSISPLVNKELGNFMTASVYVNPLAKLKPDLFAVELGWPHLLEWNLFNSVLSPNMATDFDGILCTDCPRQLDDDGAGYRSFILNAPPLYTPRKATIPLIITARIEKYREETMQWLNRHGIKVKELIMHPAKTLRERERDDICAFKARHFTNWARTHRIVGPPPLAFIESEEWQARRIATHSKRMVICPAAAGVYNVK